MNSENKYREKYIELLKKCTDVDICEECVHKPTIVCGRSCPDYVEGRGGTLDGRYFDFSWTCKDFDWGTCPYLEKTPCYGCADGHFCNFELKEG